MSHKPVYRDSYTFELSRGEMSIILAALGARANRLAEEISAKTEMLKKLGKTQFGTDLIIAKQREKDQLGLDATLDLADKISNGATYTVEEPSGKAYDGDQPGRDGD